ncbi:MAG: heparinase II/III family protein [Planctomycetes bacterium]|nr:heparinase II/III family protein [Planctomycetota bacterium]
MRDVPFRHQLEVTDDQFLDHLRLPGALGKALRAARTRGDSAQAVGIVANHFRTRAAPKWFYYMHGAAWHETDAPGSVIDKADLLMRHSYKNSWPPHQVLDIATGTADPDWDKALGFMGTATCRTTFVTELSTAFALTGKIEYARQVRDLLRSYNRTHPFILEDKFFDDHDMHFGGPMHNTLGVCYRLFRWIDLLHSGVMHVSEVYDDAEVFWFVKQIWFQAIQYYRLTDGELRRDNHHLVDHGHAPFVLGAMFPEFSVGPAMEKAGAAVIRYHFGHNLMEDGGYAEHSAEYQYHIMFHFLHPLGVAQANGIRLFTAAQIAKLRKWVEFNARLCKPNGVLPAIGDSSGRPLAHLFGTLATPVLTPELAAMARGLGFETAKPLVGVPAEIAKRMKAWKSGSASRVGLSPWYERGSAGSAQRSDGRNLPKPATKRFPNAGYTFFRDSWDAKGDYLAVSHFAKGLIGGHAHLDMLSCILHTQGETLLGDPASWLYFDKRFAGHTGQLAQLGVDFTKNHRGYSYSMQAHSCLVVNDDTLKPLSALSHNTYWGGQPPVVPTGLFQAGGPIEVLEAWHDAYAPRRHRRFVVHLVGLGFANIDIITRKGFNLAPHEYAQLWHFDGDVAIGPEEPAHGQVIRGWKNEASCVLVPGRESETQWKTWRDPFLDDVYGVSQRNEQPWVAQLTRRLRGDAVFSSFILTRGGLGLTVPPVAQYLGTEAAGWYGWQPEGISAHRLDLGPHGSVLVASCPFGKPLAHADLSTDAELAVVLLDAKNRVRSWAMVRGSKQVVGGKQLVRGARSEWRSG